MPKGRRTLKIVFKKKKRTVQRKTPRGRGHRGRYAFKYTTLIKNNYSLEMDGADHTFGQTFKLQDIPNYAELTALFDMYRISSVVAKIVPRQNTLNYQTAAGVSDGSTIEPNTDFGGTNLFGASNFGWPEVSTVIDPDDATPPTALTDILQYNNIKISRGLRTHTRYIKPRVLVDSANVGMSVRSPWIDCDKSNLPHYGLKGVFSNLPNLSIPGTSDKPVMFYDLILVYYVQFRTVK